MQYFDTEKITRIVNGKHINNNIEKLTNIIIDSRSINLYKTKENIFFAIKGIQNDGHKFIDEVYKNGVRAFVISEEVDFKKYPEAGFIKVNDSIRALQKLSAYKRNLTDIPIIGITGSNGKTIVKEWLFWLLMDKYNVVRSPKSFNSKIGVPLSLWLIEKNTEIGIIEAGISEPGEMEVLEKIIKPKIGIFTNIGYAHQKNFKSLNQKITEKLKLFKNCEKIVFCADNEMLVNRINISLKSVTKISWSAKGKGTVNVDNIKKLKNGTKIRLKYKNSFYEFSIPFIDEGSIENAITCFCSLIALDIKPENDLLKKFSDFQTVAMRLEILDGINNSTIINDTYNSDINSLKIALDFLNQKKGNKKPVIILSDILQSSDNEKKLYSDVSKLIKDKNIHKLVGIGNSLYKNRQLFAPNSEFYPDTLVLLENLRYKDFSDSCILLKGARKFEFEKISKKLQHKSHETVIETDFNLMKHNLEFFKQKLNTDVKLMAIVKAFSYGNGYQETSLFLQHNRIDYLAVAYTDEAVELRKHGIKTPILVMNPSKDSILSIIEYGLEPEIFSIDLLTYFAEYLKKSPVKSLPVHIKFDTGMHRLGIKSEEIPKLKKIIKESGKFNIISVFSHLIGADKKSFDNTTKKQVELFNAMYDDFTENLNINPLKHILNSAGIIRFPEYQFDMVRLGIGLYGITPDLSDKLIPVSTFKTTVSQIHKLKKNETIGYDASDKIKKDSVIATIPVGYADGLDRRLGNGNWEVIINKQKAKTIGNICMDMCMIDVTGINVNTGDEVIIFGQDNTIYKMAKKLDTIAYEIITKLSERVKRVYIQE